MGLTSWGWVSNTLKGLADFSAQMTDKTAGEALGLTLDKTMGAMKTIGKHAPITAARTIQSALTTMNLGGKGFGAHLRTATDRGRFESFKRNNKSAIADGSLKDMEEHSKTIIKRDKDGKQIAARSQIYGVDGLGITDRIGLMYADSAGQGGYDYWRMAKHAGGIAGAGFLLS